MKRLILIPILLLSGCGITTNQIVSLRKNTRDINRINSEIQDNLQASFWGMKHNPNPLVRNKFEDIILQIIKQPSSEEKRFAENATLDDVNFLKKETASFIRQKAKLQKDQKLIQERITNAHSSDKTFKYIILSIAGIITSVFTVLFLGYKFGLF